MNARNLIETAKRAGMGIGRRKPNLYYWWTVEGGQAVEREFSGSFDQFAAFVQSRLS